MSTADPLLGRVLGGTFEIERLLGEGGFGAVYVAKHTRTGKRYAVKVLRQERAAARPEVVRRFEREARSLAALGHPGIVAIHDFASTEDGIDYLVMDLLEGEDLSERLERTGRMPLAGALALVREIGGALAVAHGAGIVHRDLKPANIFLARAAGAPDRAMILDFGLAKMMDEATQEKLTASGVTMGTPQYMSPEQASGSALDQRTDVYALALIFYEMVAGRPPFEAPTISSLMVKILTTPPAPLSTHVPVPPHVDAAVARALEKHPEARFAEVSHLVSALHGEEAALTETRPGGKVMPATRVMDAATLPDGSPPSTHGQGSPDGPATPATWSVARHAAVTPQGVETRTASGSVATTRAPVLFMAIGALLFLGAIVVAGAVLATKAMPAASDTVEVTTVTQPPVEPVPSELAAAPSPPAPIADATDPAESPAEAAVTPAEVVPETAPAEASPRVGGRDGARSARRTGHEAPVNANATPAAQPPALPPSGAVLPASVVESYRATIREYQAHVDAIDAFLAKLDPLRQRVAGLSSGREPSLCGTSTTNDLRVSSQTPIVVSQAQMLRNDVERACAPFERHRNPPPEVRRELERISSTLDRAEEMARDRSISTNQPESVAVDVEREIGEARQALAGVEDGRRPFPCDAAVFSRLRRLTAAGNTWSGAAAERVVRMRDNVCRRIGMDSEQLRQSEQQFRARVDDAEGALRTTRRSFATVVAQYQALVP